MHQVVKYICDLCGQEFESELDCTEHEKDCFDFSSIKFMDEGLYQLSPKEFFMKGNFAPVYGMIIPDRRAFDIICRAMNEANEIFVESTAITSFPVKLWYDENVMEWICIEDKLKEIERSKERFEDAFEVKNNGK